MSIIKFYWFDMDQTLIDNDCDVSWKEFLIAHDMAPANTQAMVDAFFDDYNNGCLDHDAFSRFQLAEFAGRTYDEMLPLVRNHFVEYALPRVYPEAKALFEELQESGERVGILTSTNTIIAQPVAEFFKVDLLLGTQLEVKDGKYTGNYVPPFAGREGKVEILTEFSRMTKIAMSDMAYYGDSINDRFVLESVGHPVAVNPSAALRQVAVEKGWEILEFGK